MKQVDVNPFDVNLHEWGLILLALIPALVNLSIFAYSSLFLAKSATNRAFSVFVLLLALGQIGDGLMRISNTEETALVWNRIAIAIWSFITPAGLLFTIYFARWHKKLNPGIINLLLFVPAIGCVLFILARLNIYELVPSENMNWIANPIPGSGSVAIIAWIAFNGLLMLSVLWWSYLRKDRSLAQKKQSLLLAIGFTIPFAAGLSTEAIMPFVFGMDTFPLITPMITAFSIAAFIAISKYRLFDYSPKHQWSQIVEKMNEGLVIVDKKDRVMYANKSFCDLMEYDFSEIKGKVASELFCGNRDALNKVSRAVEARKQLAPSQYEMQVKSKSGKKIWVLMSGSPYLNSDGKVIGSIGIQTNIDYLKDVEKKVRQSTLRLKQAQTVAHMGSWELDIASGKCVLSEEACRIYGISPFENEQSFRFLTSAVHEDDLRLVYLKLRDTQTSHSETSLEHRIVLSDGAIKNIHAIYSVQLNDAGQVTGVLGICQDITVQKNIEQAHLASEQRMQVFVNNSLLPIYFLDAVSKKIVFANAALSNLLGYSQAELLGMDVYEIVNHSKQDIDKRIVMAKQKKEMIVVQREWKAKSGRIITVLVSSFFQEGADFDAIYVAAQDITEMKTAQKNMVVAREELETYIYKSSHDLRAPLASILGLITVSKMEVKDPVAIGYINMIEDQTRKLDRIRNEFLKAMRIQDMNKTGEMVCCTSVVQDVVSSLKYYEGFDRVKITVTDNSNSSFYSNTFILKTIFQNLIENSLKYQNFGRNDSWLRIEIRRKDNVIQVIVEDNGVGVDQQLHNKIFEMYYRGTETSKGSGLGLYLVKKAVEKLNGYIQFTSEPGHGTKFSIFLPQPRAVTREERVSVA